ncbi:MULTISPECIES: DUF1351 domain-containing protein [Clostridium]|uniref:DUF1351 domain-containing protein n=1 Tax=Clostridium TaxID=1485 RepID=UPI000C069148|nr:MULTISPECIES: DUF1351 domain-containing protein [Clostridium]MDU2155377.1 DUF1351 domain-containing protein [Clostridium sp.]
MDIQVKKQLPVITMNFNEIKANLTENVEKYKGLIVTEESLKDCKATQKDLAGLRNKLDGYRKDVKKEMEKPIKEFEGQCKELIGLIEEVEKPIKLGIVEFDNKKKEQKKLKAQEVIANTVITLGLEKKYAEQLTVLDKYLNLSASAKSVVEDIEQRAAALKQQQNADKAKAEMIKATIETTLDSVNKTIKTPLEYKDFEKYIEFGWDIARIVREINDKADLIRKAEQPRQEIELPADSKPKSPEVKEIKKDEPSYFVDVYVEHNFEAIQVLSKFLKDNGYIYKVHAKGKVK